MVQRAAFLICGVMTVLVGCVYGGLRSLLPTPKMPWSPFSYTLLAVGVIAVGISLQPTTWVQAITKNPNELQRSRSAPIRFLSIFAALGLLLAAVLAFLPPSLAEPPIPLVYSLCPACVVTATVGPSLGTALLLLAPLNALVFGAVGGVIGTAVILVRR